METVPAAVQVHCSTPLEHMSPKGRRSDVSGAQTVERIAYIVDQCD